MRPLVWILSTKLCNNFRRSSHSLEGICFHSKTYSSVRFIHFQIFFMSKSVSMNVYNKRGTHLQLFNFLLLFFSCYRRYLRETLKMANAEDLNRLTVCALVLLGHIFLSLGNSRESMNMVTPAMQLSSKIPDTHVQLWASAILKGKEKRALQFYSES